MIAAETSEYLILDSLGRSKWVDHSSGSPIIKTGGRPGAVVVPLPQRPQGWKDAQVGVGTNMNYWSLNRAYTTEFFFVGDGAIILRDAYWLGKGYQEELYLVILRLDPDTGIYRLEMRGRLDFLNARDSPRKGITVNAIEGGVFSYLLANESVDYEIPLDITNPLAFQIYFDGVTMFDRLRYSTLDIDIRATPTDFLYSTIPMPFLSNEGDSVGIVRGDQGYEQLNNFNSYVGSSANCVLYSIRPLVVTIKGTYKFTIKSDHYPTGQVILFFRTSLQTTGGIDAPHIVFNITGLTGQQTFTVDINKTFSLAANEKLFFMVGCIDNIANNLTFSSISSDIFFSYNTKNDPSTAFAMYSIDAAKALVSAMSGGRYTAQSNYLTQKKNKGIVHTSTNAIQNFAFQYFYGSFNTANSGGAYFIVLPGLLQTLPTDNQLVISGAASNNGIYTVLSVSPLTGGFTTIQVVEPLTNATLSGNISTVAAYKMNFKDFFNDINALHELGMKVVNDVLFIEPKEQLYTADADILDIGEITNFELEYATELVCNTCSMGYKSQDYRQRNGLYEFNTTTKSKFPVDTVNKDYSMVLKSRGDCFGAEFLRDLIFNKQTTDTTGDNQPWVIGIDLDNPLPGYPVATYPVLRENYSSIAGVLDNTVYNIKGMTPHRLLQVHLKYIRSLLVQMQGDAILFQTADKNSALSTILDGVRISERQDEIVSGKDILFYPWFANFTTVVPLQFYRVFQILGTNGYIKGTFLKQPIYLLPIGQMTGKPSTNEPQQWKLILAPNNSLEAIKNLSLEGVFTDDIMGNSIFTSYLNSLHFSKYNFVLNPQYKHYTMDDAILNDRLKTESWVSDASYQQKFQLNDKIAVQAITNGLGEVIITVFDRYGHVYRSYTMNIPVDPAVTAPYVLNNYIIDLTAESFAEGFYQFTLGDGEKFYRISEWVDIRVNHPNTSLWRYSHTTNKYNTYWTGQDFQIRIEGKFLQPYDDSTFTDYTDEISNNEVIDGIPMIKQIYRAGNGYGIPDYMMRKLGRILLLNRSFIDGTRYARTTSSKIAKIPFDGHPFCDYTIEIAEAVGAHGISTDETGSHQDPFIAITIDAQAIGQSDPGSTFTIELPNDN